jgi:RNA-directed DNA polymerase
LFDFIKRFFDGGKADYDTTGYDSREYSSVKDITSVSKKGFLSKYDQQELCRRLEIDFEKLDTINIAYQQYKIPKRSGGFRQIAAPDPDLKQIQKTILRRLLDKLAVHPHVTGFQKGHSIVTNANVHVGSAVVVRMDIKDFFPRTSAKRVQKYFQAIGWDKKAANLLCKLCTHQNGLPQGAPTSPRLSNLVNFQMDARLAGLAQKIGAAYSRYADDLTCSLKTEDRPAIAAAIRAAKMILADYGYRLHQKKKLHIRRRHQCQKVTGLVVNEKVALPRQTRRWLRAVEHHYAIGGETSISPTQLAGWRALQNMINIQS